MPDGVEFDVLSRAECLRLLPVAGLGWVSYARSDAPRMVPVRFLVHEHEVVFRTGYGERLAAAVHEPVMTLGVQALDPATGTGWYVTVTGRARLVGDPLVNEGLAAPWAGGQLLVGIPVQEVAGRRILPEAAASPSVRPLHRVRSDARLQIA
ncbi:pyridoxamine 5'-phosphate oxidase family protein [Georgenia thermotolerans]|nr:pyridoxamine 5'-phosphate oxidase family protein [Georgenia thermotolerans]